jgi:hypothetical protein
MANLAWFPQETKFQKKKPPYLNKAVCEFNFDFFLQQGV